MYFHQTKRGSRGMKIRIRRTIIDEIEISDSTGRKIMKASMSDEKKDRMYVLDCVYGCNRKTTTITNVQRLRSKNA